MTANSTEARAAPPPRALIVTVYGLYARTDGGFLSVAALIRLLAAFGVDEPAVRSAISRLKRRGLLEPRRVDGAAGYALSEAGQQVLAEGDEQIFHPRSSSLADGWLLAVFSVPESERQKRHALRARLTRLGFGTTAPGVWIAPAHRYDPTVAALTRLGLESYVDLFRADYLAFSDVPTEIGTWWDLDGLRAQYEEFIADCGPILAGWQRRSSEDREQDAFADWVRALTAWRRLPYLDPGLPAELLPAHWPASRAAGILTGLRDRLSEPAACYAATII